MRTYVRIPQKPSFKRKLPRDLPKQDEPLFHTQSYGHTSRKDSSNHTASQTRYKVPEAKKYVDRHVTADRTGSDFHLTMNHSNTRLVTHSTQNQEIIPATTKYSDKNFNVRISSTKGGLAKSPSNMLPVTSGLTSPGKDEQGIDQESFNETMKQSTGDFNTAQVYITLKKSEGDSHQYIQELEPELERTEDHDTMERQSSMKEMPADLVDRELLSSARRSKFAKEYSVLQPREQPAIIEAQQPGLEKEKEAIKKQVFLPTLKNRLQPQGVNFQNYLSQHRLAVKQDTKGVSIDNAYRQSFYRAAGGSSRLGNLNEFFQTNTSKDSFDSKQSKAEESFQSSIFASRLLMRQSSLDNLPSSLQRSQASGDPEGEGSREQKILCKQFEISKQPKMPRNARIIARRTPVKAVTKYKGRQILQKEFKTEHPYQPKSHLASQNTPSSRVIPSDVKTNKIGQNLRSSSKKNALKELADTINLQQQIQELYLEGSHSNENPDLKIEDSMQYSFFARKAAGNSSSKSLQRESPKPIVSAKAGIMSQILHKSPIKVGGFYSYAAMHRSLSRLSKAPPSNQNHPAKSPMLILNGKNSSSLNDLNRNIVSEDTLDSGYVQSQRAKKMAKRASLLKLNTISRKKLLNQIKFKNALAENNNNDLEAERVYSSVNSYTSSIPSSRGEYADGHYGVSASPGLNVQSQKLNIYEKVSHGRPHKSSTKTEVKSELAMNAQEFLARQPSTNIIEQRLDAMLASKRIIERKDIKPTPLQGRHIDKALRNEVKQLQKKALVSSIRGDKLNFSSIGQVNEKNFKEMISILREKCTSDRDYDFDHTSRMMRNNRYFRDFFKKYNANIQGACKDIDDFLIARQVLPTERQKKQRLAKRKSSRRDEVTPMRVSPQSTLEAIPQDWDKQDEFKEKVPTYLRQVNYYRGQVEKVQVKK